MQPGPEFRRGRLEQGVNERPNSGGGAKADEQTHQQQYGNHGEQPPQFRPPQESQQFLGDTESFAHLAKQSHTNLSYGQGTVELEREIRVDLRFVDNKVTQDQAVDPTVGEGIKGVFRCIHDWLPSDVKGRV